MSMSRNHVMAYALAALRAIGWRRCGKIAVGDKCARGGEKYEVAAAAIEKCNRVCIYQLAASGRMAMKLLARPKRWVGGSLSPWPIVMARGRRRAIMASAKRKHSMKHLAVR